MEPISPCLKKMKTIEEKQTCNLNLGSNMCVHKRQIKVNSLMDDEEFIFLYVYYGKHVPSCGLEPPIDVIIYSFSLVFDGYRTCKCIS